MTEVDDGKVYVGAIVPIIVDCGESVVGATGITIEIRKPDGTEVSRPAEVYQTNYLKYTTVNDGEEDVDLSQHGHYKAQGKFTLGDWSGKGETDTFRIYAPFN